AGEHDDVAPGFQIAARDVDQIGNQLKNMERDSDRKRQRQQDRIYLEARKREHRRDIGREEIEIFIDEQDREIADDPKRQKLSPGIASTSIEQNPYDEIEQGDAE